MTLTAIATIINFCSNDYPFLGHCIRAVAPFSSQIIVPVCDHFFDGHPEDPWVLRKIYAENQKVQFVEFPFDAKKDFLESVYWHNLARLVGSFFLKQEIQQVLFLDCDEIVDTKCFLDWLRFFPFQEYQVIEFSTYWYFRESCFQAKTWEHTPLWIKKEILEGALLMNERERAGMYDACPEKKMSRVLSQEGLPMFHHYSWVRTKEQLLRKVRCWSHRWQRRWVQQVEEEFSHEFLGKDFVHGYEFSEVTPYIEIDLKKGPQGDFPCDFSHVRKLTHEEVSKIDVSLHFQIPVRL